MGAKTILLAGLAGLSIGCGSSSTNTGGGTPIEELPALYADVLCGMFEECADALLQIFPEFLDDCNENFTNELTDEGIARIQAAIDAGTVTYHGENAQTCLDALEAAGCDLLTERFPPECEDLFEGTVPLGEDCNVDEECSDAEAFCLVEASCPGTCAALLGEGETCSDNSNCESGLVCDESITECAVPGGEGDACGAGDPECELGLLCFGENEEAGTGGTCTTADDLFTEQVDGTCNIQDGPMCEIGLSCVLTGAGAGGPTFECQEEVASGATCAAGFPDQCPEGEWCSGIDFETGDFEGTCEDLPGEGEDCAATIGPAGCASGLTCSTDTETCIDVVVIGESCDEDEACYSNNCASGTCEEPEECDVPE